MDVVETELLVCIGHTHGNLGVVPDTVDTQTHTDGGGPPLTEVKIRCEADVSPVLGVGESGNYRVNTTGDADEGVVKSLVGFISAADDLAILVAIVVLLSVGVHGEEETCNCKGSQNHLDTFHDKSITIIYYLIGDSRHIGENRGKVTLLFQQNKILIKIF